MTENVNNEETVLSSHKPCPFTIPTKCVKNVQDITVWEKSEAYQV